MGTGLPLRFNMMVLALALVALPFLALSSTSVYAAAEYTTKARFAYMIDADTNSVLFSKNPNQLIEPASMSKLMTLAVLFRALKAGELSLEDEFMVSVNAWRKGGGPSGAVSMFAPLNKFVKISDLIEGIAVQSANDAAIIIAEGLEGSEEAFAKRMTREAREIGMTKSTFGNSTGLEHPDQLMTGKDLAILSLHLIREYPQFYHYFSKRKFAYRRYKFYNRNPMISSYKADGLKTGYNKKGGYSLVTSKVSNRRRLILAVGGLKTKKARKREAIRIMNWGFNKFRSFRVFEPNQTVGSARVLGGTKMYMPLAAKNWDEIRVLLPTRDKIKKVKASIVYRGPLRAPVQQGEQVAFLKIRAKGTSTSTIPLYATETIEPSSPLWRGFDTLLFHAFGWLF